MAVASTSLALATQWRHIDCDAMCPVSSLEFLRFTELGDIIDEEEYEEVKDEEEEDMKADSTYTVLVSPGIGNADVATRWLFFVIKEGDRIVVTEAVSSALIAGLDRFESRKERARS